MLKDLYICAFDVHYLDEDFISRHNKGFYRASYVQEVIDYLDEKFNIESITKMTLEWIEGKDEMIFTESEFHVFNYLKKALEDDHSSEDYLMAVKEKEAHFERYRENSQNFSKTSRNMDALS